MVKQHGNIDHYVRNQLQYPTTEKLWKGLAAEQVDGLGLYLSQFESSQGIIIADQTGIGKGRQAAGVIRHAILSGYLPVFFTRQPNLFTDMYRDLKNIDFAAIHPFIVNTDSAAKIKDAQGHVVFSPLSSKAQYELLVTEKEVPTDSPEAIAWYKTIGKLPPDPKDTPTVTLTQVRDTLPEGYDCIFCTYSQIQAAHPYKRLWLAGLVGRGVQGSTPYKKVVFILDESHTAGGFHSIIGQWMRGVLPQTQAACFLSATFAKYQRVMPFYAKKTAIAETGLSDTDFVRAMIRGGLALQELVASNLTDSGQLIRRQRSNEGIKVEYITLDQEPQRSKNRDSVNRIISLMNQIVAFEQEYITPIREEIHAKAKAAGERLENKPKSLGVKQAPYFSKVFNIIDQILFALKVEEVAAFAIDLLRQNKKVVIAFKSTMGAFLKDLNLVSGDVILPGQMDFATTLIKGLDSLFYYNYTDIGGHKSREKIALSELPPSGQQRYEQLIELTQEETTGLSISPIDQLIHHIESVAKSNTLGGHNESHFKVVEVTGRNQRIRLADGTVASFRSDVEKSFRLFNNGQYDVLLINQSGSTGASAHASMDFEDQRQRAMIIHQFELDINVEIQKRGRINRTGQVVPPEYYYITSAIPMEKRLLTMLKAKLKSLDANTTGSQKTSEDQLHAADFLNKYGDKVAWQWVEENPELTERMGMPTYHKKTDSYGTRWVRNDTKDGAIRQLTGRAGLLTVEEQDILYNELLEAYHLQLAYEKQQGTYDLETEFLQLDAEVKKRYMYQKGKGGKTPFGRDTIRDESIVNNLKRPFTKGELDKLMQDTLNGKTPKQLQVDLITAIADDYPKIVEERKASRMKVIVRLEKERDTLPAIKGDTEAAQKKRDKIKRRRDKLQEHIHTKQHALNQYINDLEQVKTTLIKTIQYWTIGDVVLVPILGSSYASWGLFMGVSLAKSKNPYTLAKVSLRFAVADARKVVEYNLTPSQRAEISTIYTESKDINEDERVRVNGTWNELIREASSKREKRHILTENIVGASATIDLSNKLIKYNTQAGEIKNGILMHRDFGQSGDDKKTLLPLSEANTLLRELAIDGQFRDHKNQIRFQRISEKAYQVFVIKKGNFEVFTDTVLRSLIIRAAGQSEDELADFVQNAGEMTAALHIDKLHGFLERLDHFGFSYYSEAKALEDWEIENQDDWEAKTQAVEGSYRYRLARAYGMGSNPTMNFKSYEPPDATYPFGVVAYSRPLSDKEKFNFSLIPLFDSVHVPYNTWKAYIKDNPILDKEWTALLETLRHKPLYKALVALGDFITNNPHEDGNIEFVFGAYNPIQLGQAAWEATYGAIGLIDELILQLTLALDTSLTL